MGRLKSFVKSVRLDVAERSHNCQHSAAHRISRGDVRVRLQEGRSVEHFCRACASQSLASDIGRLQRLLEELNASTDVLMNPTEDPS